MVPPRPNSNYAHTSSPSPATQAQQQPQQQTQQQNANRQYQEYNQFGSNAANNEGSQSRPSSVSIDILYFNSSNLHKNVL